MPPPIRYPLPTLVLVLLVCASIWLVEPATRSLRSGLGRRWHRVISGPDYPKSATPQVVDGGIVRKALLLHDDVAASDRPEGPDAHSIRFRMFVDVFDRWPLAGKAEWFRVGNRQAIGWVSSADLLPWNTRLVIRPSEAIALSPSAVASEATKVAADRSLPVLSWTPDAVEVAVWDESQPWAVVARRGWVWRSALRPEWWGVWLSRDELIDLLRRTLERKPESADSALRIRAVLGRISDGKRLESRGLETTRRALPAEAFTGEGVEPSKCAEALAEINERWEPETSWSGLTFQFLPISNLP